MSFGKRKDAPGAQNSTKTTKAGATATDERPSKRSKPSKTSKGDDASSTKQPKRSIETEAPKPKAPLITRLKEDEPLFPRGGGGILTPLEKKQIQIQATKDALFEQEGETHADGGDKSHKKKRRKSTAKDTKHSGKTAPRDEDAVKIESLNYKRLVKGSMVLGQVCDIDALEMSLALPNNLTGHVSIASISDALTQRIESEAADEDTDDDEDSDTDLTNMFYLGQYVRAYVLSTMEDAATPAGRVKRRIELSLKPAHANSGLTEADLVDNCAVMASVQSEQDHGYIMDIDIDGSKMQGFLAKKNAEVDAFPSGLQLGQALLCSIIGRSGKVVQLTNATNKLGNIKHTASTATTINTFLPGTAADVLISEVTSRGITGKVLGSLDVTADICHTGAGPLGTDLEDHYKSGKRLKARVICTFPGGEKPKLGISILEHITGLEAKQVDGKQPLEALPTSSIVERCTVRKVESDIGLWVDVGLEGIPGFVHISRVKDGKVDALFESSGPYKVGSVHRGRVVGYNAIDGVFLLSFEKHILEQLYLNLEDVPVGKTVNGTVEKMLVGEKGVSGLIVKLADGITGLVPESHLADVRLQHPEKKFKEGMKVKARVLSKDLGKRQLRLTLKKTLVNSDLTPIQSFDELTVGLSAVGTIINVLPNGAVVQFYGSLRGFLPISEMSEAFIRDPLEHFRVGQVLNVRVLKFDAANNKLTVSCKDPSAFGMDKQVALKNLKIGDIVSAKITQKTEDDIFLELSDSSLKATLPIGHLTDKSTKQNRQAAKNLHVGQTLARLVVWNKHEERHSLTLSQKPSLLTASEDKTLVTSLEGAKLDAVVPSIVRNITASAAIVQLSGSLTALLPRSLMLSASRDLPDFGLKPLQPLSVKIISTDNQRLVVAIPSFDKSAAEEKRPKEAKPVVNPLDDTVSSIDDLPIGKVTKARITAVRETQLQVKLADNIQGRIDASEIFDSWDEIADPKNPLATFRVNEVVKVRVLGVHSAKNHTFLPISHRTGNSVIDLTAKPSKLADGTTNADLTWDTVAVGSTLLGFVNNYGRNQLWVTLSPTVTGKLTAMEATNDLSQLYDLRSSFPLGSALKVRVLSVDGDNRRLVLSARSKESVNNVTWDTLKQNMVLPGKVTRVSERQVMVQLSDTLAAPVHLVDLTDNYDNATTLPYGQHDIIRVAVVEFDKPNKKIRLSTRPSRILNSALSVEDPELTKDSVIEPGAIIRGFVKNVTDKGVFVSIGGDHTAFVRVSDLSDKYLKDWKEHFQIDQLVKGRILSVDPLVKHIGMTLKTSVVDNAYVAELTLKDVKVGQVVTGKVRKVEDYGAFIVLDNFNNVSGLCHRSEMAEKSVGDARKLYTEGDKVKAKVLAVDLDKRRINFGLKPSYFEDEDEDASDSDMGGAGLNDSDDDLEGDSDDDMGDLGDVLAISGTDNAAEEESDEDVDMEDQPALETGGLDAGGFDWSGGAMDASGDEMDVDADETSTEKKKKKKKRPEIQVDRTAELDAHGPQTASDFERLLLGQPDSSSLWIAYMAFQMQVSELEKARETAERAIRTINVREETEKLNVWIALLNLEVAYGTDETVDEVFKRACQYNEEQEIYERLTTIYIKSSKHEKADELFEALVKKFGAKSQDVWYNYAHFLHNVVGEPDRGRKLLARANQALGQRDVAPMTARFAALEFRSSVGSPELGRTLFEGLLNLNPKRFDRWNQLLDLEIAAFKAAPSQTDAGRQAVRDVFERAMKVEGFKVKQAAGWYRRWAKWEEEFGHTDADADEAAREKSRKKSMDRVMKLAREDAERRKAKAKARAEAEAAEE